MRQWSENEIFSFLIDHLRQAASDCEDLAVNRRKGPVYNHFRITLERIEDMCRIVHYMRQDARWLKTGLIMERCHQAAGDWLRGVPQKPGLDGKPKPARPLPEGMKHPLFLKLADFLREQEREVLRLKNEKTNRIGMILPRMLEPPGVRQPTNYRIAPLRSKGGIILPSGVKAA